MKIAQACLLIVSIVSLCLSGCGAAPDVPTGEIQAVTVVTVRSEPVTLTESYVAQIHSHHHIEVRAPEAGQLTAVEVREGQAVKKDDLLFQINTRAEPGKRNPVNKDRLISVTAPFDGLVDRLPFPRDSFVQRSEVLTTLSDNSQMWVYFNVPESRYLEEYSKDVNKDDLKIELVLADGKKFAEPGTLGAIAADFNNATASIPFRADFANPTGLLRHGERGTVHVSRELKNAVVIPQRATLEILGKRYVSVVDADDVAHRREIAVGNAIDDGFVVKTGLHAGDKIVVEGARQLRDGAKLASDEPETQEVAAKRKYHVK